MASTMSGLGLFLAIFLIILAILWMFMPFLLMGTNSRLDKIIAQNERLLSKAGHETRPKEGVMDRLADTLYKERHIVGPSGESS